MPGAAGKRGKAFIDLQNDVCVSDVALAARENYRSVEHLKRYTTTGMGTDQGKTSNVNALILMGQYTQRAPDQVGTTRFRPPFVPVTLGAIVGRRTGALYRPLKRLPAHEWHAAHGALFETLGDWSRPVAYPLTDESLETAAQREARAVRERAGLFDGSPLGKLEVFGPDAATFLDLMYVGTMSSLAIGQARYGVLLNENGTVVDDGIVARLGPERFWVNTTTAGIERTQAAFEEWLQCEFVDLKVLITPVTARWANITVAGPRAWQWLAAARFDPELAPAEMKHMTLRDTTLEGVPVRVLRASFSGELGYELNLPAPQAAWLLERLWALAGRVRWRAVRHRGAAGDARRKRLRAHRHGHRRHDAAAGCRLCTRHRTQARRFRRAALLDRPAGARPAATAAGRPCVPGWPHGAAGGRPDRAAAAADAHRGPRHLELPECSARPSRRARHARCGTQRLGEEITVYHLGTCHRARIVAIPFLDPAGARLNG